TRAARRRTMNETRDGASMLGLDDEYIPAVSLGHDVFLQVLRRVLAAYVGLQRAAQSGALLAQPFADGLQCRTRVVDDIAGRLYLLSNRNGLSLERRDGCRHGLEGRERAGRTPDGLTRLFDRIEKIRKRHEPKRLERPPLDRQLAQDLGQFGGGAQRKG